MKQRLFTLFMAVLLLLHPYTALADKDTSDYIDSEEAFWEWIDSHPNGGSISLGLNITLTRHIMLSGPLSIDTGAYGVTMDGGSIPWLLTITGEGVDTPVLTIVDLGIRFGSWDGYLCGYNVTARGRDGEGGVAVRVATGKDGSPYVIDEYQGHIRSEGTGAVGVLFDSLVKAHFLSVSVEGENSAAVSAPEGASLYYSKLQASGQDAKAAIGRDILLDTCRTEADTSGIDVVDRKIVALAGNWLYWPLEQDREIQVSDPYQTFYFTTELSFLLSGDEAHPAEVRRIYAYWDRDAIDDIDTSIVGETVVSGGLFGPYQGLGLEDDFLLDVTVDVHDGSKPYIIFLKFGDEIGTDRHYVYFNTRDFEEYGFQPDDGNFILWRSDDEGQSWYDFTDSPDVSFGFTGIAYYYEEITKPVWFCIQEAGGEYSNIAIINGYEGKTYGSHGGDRTGVDRGGGNAETESPLQSLPPSTPIPTTVPIPVPTPIPTSKPVPVPTPTPVSTPTPIPVSVPTSTPKPVSLPTSTPKPVPVSTSVPTRIPALSSGLGGRSEQMPSGTAVEVKTELSIPLPDDVLTLMEKTLPVYEALRSDPILPEEWDDNATTDVSDGLDSGIYDSAETVNEADMVPLQTSSSAAATDEPSSEPSDHKKTTQSAAMEENNLSVKEVAIFAFLGAGYMIGGATIFLKVRVKNND